MNDSTETPPSHDMPGDGAAAALALGAASREKADRFLEEQTRVAEAQGEFIRLQSEDFRADETVRRQTLRLHHSSTVMKVALEVTVALVILFFAVVIGSAIWYAAHDDGLVIEPFSVPPEMAARGLSGDVVAARMLDKLAQLQAQTVSNRAASSYANDWGNDIKVQVPYTGISIGQAYQYLAQWLGHETHISGEVFRDTKGAITVTARVGPDASPNFAGDEGDFDKLMQQAAESIYQKTQPYRFAVYLANRGRTVEADAAYRELVKTGTPEDRAWGYVGLSTLAQAKGDIPGAIGWLRHSIDIVPDFAMGYLSWSNDEGQLQHDQKAYDLERKVSEIFRGGNGGGMDARSLAIDGPQIESALAAAGGDFQSQLAFNKATEKLPEFAGQVENAREFDIQAYAFLHDGAGVRDALAVTQAAPAAGGINRAGNILIANYLLDQWDGVISGGTALEKELAPFGPLVVVFVRRGIWPPVAVGLVSTGNRARGDALIARTPLDCDVCLRLRGRIAMTEHRWDAANYWYAMVAARMPSIPFADSDWGMMLLAKGDADAAITKFTAANRKGPHYADPLEGWGEALMMKNRSDLAVNKFAQSAQYAPNWGRLHLKWGEALVYAGKIDDARKQFAVAAGLDLSAADTIELAHMRAAHG
jgi:tetratricopeptide (TPR) repeat protein